MKRLLVLTSILLAVLVLHAQERDSANPEQSGESSFELPVVQVQLVHEDASFFKEKPATSTVALPQDIAIDAVTFEDPGNFRLLDYIVIPASGNRKPSLELRWYAIEDGLQTFPAVTILGNAAVYQTKPSQLLVKSPVRSDDLSLSFKPEKTTVYAGEPLRMDVIWKADISTKRIRSLECYPAFFNDPGLEISVPRSTDPESRQIGLPFGGRRIIARRDSEDNNESDLGTVSFPLYIKFKEPGFHQLDSVRLFCSELQQDGGPLAPYAAYYNNGLFERVEKGSAYERIYTDSEPVLIEVIPLPQAGRQENFSGLFLPCKISAAITPDEINVGQLMTLDITVESPVASDFLQLPSLAKQKSLRSWFKVDPELTRTWLPDGAQFTARIRALTTRVKAIPSLQFQVFDPQSGSYSILTTEPMPISVLPQDGKDYFDSKVLLDTTSTLTPQDEGVWHNRGANPMHNLLDTILTTATDYFWILILFGPLAFAVLLPRVLELRRQELDPVYRRQLRAYRKFRKLPEGDPAKWNALKELIATSLNAEPRSWTSGDSRDKLRKAGLDKETIETICQCHQVMDLNSFSITRKGGNLPPLKPIGQRVFKVLTRLGMILLAGTLFVPGDADAMDWEAAQSAFESAMQKEAGTPEYYNAYSEAALIYEAVAQSGGKPGLAWYNAGNAWFFAGEIGRSIACYKQARAHRPFDPLVKKNLSAARALAIDVVTKHHQPFWVSWPVRWVAFILIIMNFLFWGFLLWYIRFRTGPMLLMTASSLFIVILLAALSLYNAVWRNQPGVVIGTEVFARKGPGYHYQTAFLEPLHDGLEFELIESRGDWANIELMDGRRCWIPASQVQMVDLSI